MPSRTLLVLRLAFCLLLNRGLFWSSLLFLCLSPPLNISLFRYQCERVNDESDRFQVPMNTRIRIHAYHDRFQKI